MEPQGQRGPLRQATGFQYSWRCGARLLRTARRGSEVLFSHEARVIFNLSRQTKKRGQKSAVWIEAAQEGQNGQTGGQNPIADELYGSLPRKCPSLFTPKS